MALTRRISRPMMAAMFISGGIDSLQHPEGKAKKADRVARAFAEPLGLPDDPVTLVRLNGAVQVGAGLLFASGKLPRLSALALAGTLVPTTLAGHAFWAEDDPQTKRQQRIHFLKNLSMLGGLLLAAFDTEGRPSVTWRAKHVAATATEKAAAALPGH